jgi:hypothetical protein
MPIESINCPQCGSTEVTEFKPDSYVCGHCEAIFKHVSPVRAAAPPESCFLCDTDSVATCSSCSRRVCNKHMVMRAEHSYSHFWNAPGVMSPVLLSHPTGESFEALGAILAYMHIKAGRSDNDISRVTADPTRREFSAFASGAPRCWSCRASDGIALITKDGDVGPATSIVVIRDAALNRIRVIKAVRESLGCGLREAAQLVDSAGARVGPLTPALAHALAAKLTANGASVEVHDS